MPMIINTDGKSSYIPTILYKLQKKLNEQAYTATMINKLYEELTEINAKSVAKATICTLDKLAETWSIERKDV